MSDLTVSQRVFDDAGGSTGVSITGTTIFWCGGDHNHWRIRDVESGTLTRVDNGKVVGTLAKHGFLIHDRFRYNGSLPGSPGRGVYTQGNYPSMTDHNALAVTEASPSAGAIATEPRRTSSGSTSRAWRTGSTGSIRERISRDGSPRATPGTTPHGRSSGSGRTG